MTNSKQGFAKGRQKLDLVASIEEILWKNYTEHLGFE